MSDIIPSGLRKRWSSRCSAPLLLIAVATVLFPEMAAAELKPELPTLSLGGRAYWATSKSGLVESNDTGLFYSYGINVYAGDHKNLSVHLENKTAQTTYALNSTSTSQEDLAFIFRYYFSFFYIGGFAGSTKLLATRADGSSADIFANKYGANTGLIMNVTRSVILEVDARGGIPLDVKEANNQTVTLGTKIEGQVTVIFDLTRKLLDLEAGFAYSSQEATFEGTGTGETTTAPFVGLTMSTSF